jgi:hypothetical protein
MNNERKSIASELDTDIERLGREARRAVTAGDENERLSDGLPADALRFEDRDIAELRQERASPFELQERAGGSGCAGFTTVIEARFPDISVRKKTAAETEEAERWLAVRSEEGLKIDPATAEVDWSYGWDLDPYGICDELPEEFQQVGRQYWARSPGSDIWVHFGDLPQETRERLWTRQGRTLAFPVGLEGIVAMATQDTLEGDGSRSSTSP